MKILKRLLISILVLLLVLVVAAIIFVKTFDINRFKPRIINQASSALHRRVDFEKAELGISLSQGIRLKISNLVIGEDPAFGKGDFLAVKEVSLGVDVLGYLFQKELRVPSVLIDAPRVSLIRQKDGGLNVQSLGRRGEEEKEEKKEEKPASVPVPVALPAVFISSLRIASGTLSYVDHSCEPALEVKISDLLLSVSKLSLTDPFPFSVEAALLSAKRNIKLEGKAQLDLKTNKVTLSELKGSLDLSALLLKQIPAVFPMVKGAVLPQSLEGKADLKLEKMTAGPQGLTVSTADASLEDVALNFKEIPSPIDDLMMHVTITKTEILFDKVSAAMGEGEINGSGSIDDYLNRQDFSTAMDIKNLRMQDLIRQDKSAVKAEGVLSGQIRLRGQGLNPQALSSALSGEGRMSVREARLKDINVLHAVLDKISMIPLLTDKIEANLPPYYKQKLTQPDTVLADIELPFTIASGRIFAPDTVIATDEFLFKGKTEVGFDGTFSVEGSFLVKEEFSKLMVTAVPTLQYLLDRDRQIFIPLKISGRASEMKFNVDLDYIGKRLLASQAETQLLKVINKAIGKEESDAGPSSGSQGTDEEADTAGQNAPQAGTDKKSTLEDLVGGILGTILKK